MSYAEQDEQLKKEMSLIQELIYKDPELMIQKCYELKNLAKMRNNTYCGSSWIDVGQNPRIVRVYAD